MLSILLFLAAMQQTPAHLDRAAEEAELRRILGIAELEATVKSERVAGTPPAGAASWRFIAEGRGPTDRVVFFLKLATIRHALELESVHADGEHFSARFVAAAGERKRMLEMRELLRAWPDDTQLRLTGVEVDATGEMRLRGVALGAAARAAVLASMRAAKFAVPRMELAPSGACRPFVMTVARGTAETKFSTAPLTSPLCGNPAPRAAQRITARGTKGPLTMQLRNVELSSFFQILNQLTGEDFVVDAGVTGVFDIDLDKATLADALAAIPGVVISPGPLRRVSRTPKEPLAQTYTGDPVSLVLTDADLPSVLCLMERITGLGIRVSPESQARVSIVASDVRWDHALEAIIAGANLTYKIEDIQLFVGPRASAIPACEAAIRTEWRFTSVPVTLEQLARSDLDVAGVVQHEGKWKAYLTGPPHRLWLVEPGQKLFDTRIKSIASTGVVFE